MQPRINEILRVKRKEKKLSVKQVAETLKTKGVDVAPKTIYNWETGHSDPMPEVFLALCQIYEVGDILEEFGYVETNKDDFFCNSHEQHIIEKIRNLDAHGMDMVTSVLEKEHARMESIRKQGKERQEKLRLAQEAQKKQEKIVSLRQEPPEEEDEEEPEKIKMKVYNQPAAAGLGSYVDEYTGDDYDMMEFDAEEVPRRAVFGIRISGDSMEPTIEDGDIVWIELAKPENGEIGVFVYENGSYCKEVSIERNRGGTRVTLVSHNDDYDDIEIEDLDQLRIVGRVIF